ncbi:MAG: O-antigen ligase family protein, partial [bacterium]|nr:O-antigen ligase family protein [bacterium]
AILLVCFILLVGKYKKLRINRKNAVVLLSIILLTILFMLTPFGERLLQLNLSDKSIANRLSVFTATIKTVTQKIVYFFWGVGSDKFGYYTKLLCQPNNISADYENTHSFWFQILVDSGLISLGIFTSIFIAFWVRLRVLKIPIRSIHYGLFAVLIIALLVGITEIYFMHLIGYLIFWFQVGMLAYLLRNEKQEGSIPWFEKHIPLISILVIV